VRILIVCHVNRHPNATFPQPATQPGTLLFFGSLNMNSIFELFKVGVGPSSSHTVGPMIAAQRFASDLLSDPQRSQATDRIRVDLYGSLALTGRGHATDSAVIAGLCGLQPATVDPRVLAETVTRVRQTQRLTLSPDVVITFDEPGDLVFNTSRSLPFHPNGVRFSALDASGNPVFVDQYYSVGGGFVVSHAESQADATATQPTNESAPSDFPFPFTSSAELIDMCDRSGLSIDEIVNRNELVRRSQAEIDAQLDLLWDVMRQSIERGCKTDGVLPGGLKVRRRAPAIHQKLTAAFEPNAVVDPLAQLDHVSLYALAVNEENAAGGKVVTAPTNGAAGVIPAVDDVLLDVLSWRHDHRWPSVVEDCWCDRTAVQTQRIAISGRNGLPRRSRCRLFDGRSGAWPPAWGVAPRQIANAAEIGMEHNLGLTCDPVGGLVQIPCIERNTMGATKAINAARLAVLYGDGSHKVSLDRVIETMRQTGVDMQSKYKETSLGGLAVNVVNC